MKVTFPLSLKVSVWLLLNLLLLAVLGMGFLVMQGGLSWDALVTGPSGERAQSTANVIAGEAAAANAANRPAVLARFGAAYRAEFFLVRPDNAPSAESTWAMLPAEVRSRIDFRTPRFGPGAFGGRGDATTRRTGPGPGHGESGPRRPPSPDTEGTAPREPTEAIRRETPEAGRAFSGFDFGRERGRFVVRAGSPTSYWIGLRVPFVSPERGRFPLPTLLVVRVDSLWSLMRFLDLQPWLYAGTGVLALSVLFWLPLVRGITRALTQLTVATEQIADGRFDTRVPARRRDELGQLGASVNRMAARLDTHMSGQKRFLGDVAHELCSPLARLQMATGILTERAPETLRDTVTDVRDEVQQMSTLVNELLAFTKAGLQQRQVALTPVELAPVVQAVLAREDLAGKVTTSVPEGLHVLAEPEILERVLANVVRNAIRYAGEAGPISLSARADSGRVAIAVDDEGPGVPPEALDRLGEPFFRPEAARTRELGGVGLGLSIVRSGIAACGGEVRFANRLPHGFRAELILAAT